MWFKLLISFQASLSTNVRAFGELFQIFVWGFSFKPRSASSAVIGSSSCSPWSVCLESGTCFRCFLCFWRCVCTFGTYYHTVWYRSSLPVIFMPLLKWQDDLQLLWQIGVGYVSNDFYRSSRTGCRSTFPIVPDSFGWSLRQSWFSWILLN